MAEQRTPSSSFVKTKILVLGIQIVIAEDDIHLVFTRKTEA